MLNSFIDLNLHKKEDLRYILSSAVTIKKNPEKYKNSLTGKQLAMIFEKPSTRTRVSFEVGINQLGGNSIVLHSNNMQLSRGESVYDTAKVLSRYVDIIAIRCYQHSFLEELDKYSEVPVINGLTDYSHPCQIMADIMTFEEKKCSIENSIVLWVGDCNNVLTSWIHAAVILGFKLKVSSPKEAIPDYQPLIWAQERNSNISWYEDPKEAVPNVDLIVTDSWVSMGNESNEDYARFSNYQVNKELVSLAKKNFVFLHCLPAYRGKEVTAEVMEGPNSLVFDEAENRLHVQKAIMLWCLKLL
ncbi:MAG: ornithine carbamoyltransferase [Wolbachia endosymbiont of Xenopsylla cheopis]